MPVQKNNSKILEPNIFIVGSCQIQNELLDYFIEQSMKIRCKCCNNILQLKPSDFSCSNKLILYNCHNYSPMDLWNIIQVNCINNNADGKMALINAVDDPGFVLESLSRGIKGVFYANDSLATLKKGVKAILKGELWYSREIMSLSLQKSQNSSKQNNKTKLDLLTKREREILSLISTGNSNSEISAKLHISPYTVKTHINNIYGKINTPNRLQALLWATKNL